MTELSKLYEFVKDNVDWADEYFIKNINASNELSDITFILVRDSTQDMFDYGSNRFQTMQYGMQIQIFYASDSDLDYDEVEMSLLKKLLDDGYLIDSIRGRIQDPDTFQDYQTILVHKQKGVY